MGLDHVKDHILSESDHESDSQSMNAMNVFPTQDQGVPSEQVTRCLSDLQNATM